MAVPKKDSLLVSFSRNFNDRIVASRETYFLTEEQVELYTEKHLQFVEAYTTLIAEREAGMRSEAQTARKAQRKRELQSYARELYGMVQANNSVSDADKILLGVHVQAAARPTPQPTARPGVSISSVFNRSIVVNIYDADVPTRRGKPASTVAAWVYTFVGTDFPSDPAAWNFAGACAKPKHEITFPSTVPAGARVWVCAAWINRRQEPGPKSLAISTNLQGGGSVAEGVVRMAA